MLDGSSRKVSLQDTEGRNTIKLGGEDASIISGDKGKAGTLSILGANGKNSITLNGNTDDIVLKDKNGDHSFGFHGQIFAGKGAGLWIGGNKKEGEKAGYIAIRDGIGTESIIVDGLNRSITLAGTGGASIFIDGAGGDITE